MEMQTKCVFEAIKILKQKLYDYNKIYNERKSVINELLDKEINLCKDLGLQQKGLSTSPTLPTYWNFPKVLVWHGAEKMFETNRDKRIFMMSLK